MVYQFACLPLCHKYILVFCLIQEFDINLNKKKKYLRFDIMLIREDLKKVTKLILPPTLLNTLRK